jgi:uncharacterized protein YukE
MSNIRVDPEILEEFANALAQFQDTLEGELQSLNSEFSRFSETAGGRKQDEFAESFNVTCQSINQAVEAGRGAAERLNRYQEQVRQTFG